MREHYWDSLRGLLMLLGIPFHVAMCFRAGDTWIAASQRGGLAYTWASDFIHLFRMPAFFVVAGYFAAMLLARRRPTEWLKGRLMRLGVPFVASLLLIVPLLNIACEYSVHPGAAAWSAFRDNMANSGGYWVRHLWFLIVLTYYNVAATLLVMWRPRMATAQVSASADSWAARHRVPLLIAIALLVGGYEYLAALPFHGLSQLASRRAQELLRLDEALFYLPFFTLGATLQRSRAFLDTLGRRSIALSSLTGVTTIAAIALFRTGWSNSAQIVGGVAAILLTQQLLALARARFDRPSAAVRRLVAASFVIYLFHLPVIALLVDLLRDWRVPLIVLFVTINLVTLVACYLIWLVVERVPLFNFLFNGIRSAKPVA